MGTHVWQGAETAIGAAIGIIAGAAQGAGTAAYVGGQDCWQYAPRQSQSRIRLQQPQPTLWAATIATASKIVTFLMLVILLSDSFRRNDSNCRVRSTDQTP